MAPARPAGTPVAPTPPPGSIARRLGQLPEQRPFAKVADEERRFSYEDPKAFVVCFATLLALPPFVSGTQPQTQAPRRRAGRSHHHRRRRTHPGPDARPLAVLPAPRRALACPQCLATRVRYVLRQDIGAGAGIRTPDPRL